MIKCNDNKIINHILNYDNPSNYNEIIQCLSNLKYSLNDESYPKFDKLLNILINNGYEIYNIINNHNNLDFSNTDVSIKNVLNIATTELKHDNFLKKYSKSITSLQIEYLSKIIKEKIYSDSYTEKRFIEIISILKEREDINSFINNVFTYYLDINNLKNNSKLSDATTISYNYSKIIDENSMNSFLDLVLQIPGDTLKGIGIINKLKNYISIENLKKIPSYVASSIDKLIYKEILSIYSNNIDKMLSDNELKKQLMDFLLLDIEHSDSIITALNLLTTNYETIDNLNDLIFYYINNDSFNSKEEEKIIFTINKYMNNYTDDDVLNSLVCILSKNTYTDEKINKILKLFNEQAVMRINMIDNYENYSDVLKTNMILINIINRNFHYMNCWLNKMTDDSLIIDSLRYIKQTKIRFTSKLKKNDLNITLSKIYENTTNDVIKEIISEMSTKYSFSELNKEDESVQLQN